jgi:hypothetical protein
MVLRSLAGTARGPCSNEASRLASVIQAMLGAQPFLLVGKSPVRLPKQDSNQQPSRPSLLARCVRY